MHYKILKLTFCAMALMTMGAAGVGAAEAGLSLDRAGLGLKPARDAGTSPSIADFGSEYLRAWRPRHASDYALYAGAREMPRLGLQQAASYGGVFYPFSEAWASSLAAGVTPESWVAPRRYSLTGRMHTALGEGGVLSVGLRYQTYDTSREITGAPATAPMLSFLRVPGTSLAPGYQLQLSYQYSPASAFGLALGRDLETLIPGFDVPPNGLRQLTFTGQHWLTPSWALSYDVLSNDPASPLRVQGLRLGVRYRF